MPKPEDFRGKPIWDLDDLNSFLGLRAREVPMLEYKDERWVAPDGCELRSTFPNELREYAAAMSTDGGGLFFLGVNEDGSGRPDSATGVPRAVWGRPGPSKRVEDILTNGIRLQLYPPPRIHAVEVAEQRDVIVIDLPKPAHKYYAVTHGGGWVPLRSGESIIRASPAVEALLAGVATSKPAIELHPYDRREIRDMPEELWRWHLDRAHTTRPYPFFLRNLGPGEANEVRIGLVATCNHVANLELTVHGTATQPAVEERTTLPRAWRDTFEVQAPVVKEYSLRPLRPGADLEISIGAQATSSLFLRNINVGVYMMGANIDPFSTAYHVYGVGGPAADFHLGIEPLPKPWKWGSERYF